MGVGERVKGREEGEKEEQEKERERESNRATCIKDLAVVSRVSTCMCIIIMLLKTEIHSHK